MAGPPKTSSLVATRQLCLEIAEVTRGCVLCQSVTVLAEGGGQSISGGLEVLCRFAVTLRASFVVKGRREHHSPRPAVRSRLLCSIDRHDPRGLVEVCRC